MKSYLCLSSLLLSVGLLSIVPNKVLARTTANCESEAYEKVDDENLDQLFVVMRHGVRAPWTTYPLDPNANQTNRWPNGRSQLTDFGIQQSSNIGKLLKIRYGKFLEKIDNRKQVFLRSSASQRCFDTLNLVTQEILPEFKLFKKPVVYSLPKKIDSILYEEPHCPEGDHQDEQSLQTFIVQEYENSTEIQILYQLVSELTGLDATMSGVTKAFDCLRCDRINGHPLPYWVTKENDIYNQMGDVLTKQLEFLYANRRAQRLRAGPFLQGLIEEIDKFRSNLNEYRLHLYTTHDVKIAAIIKALGAKLDRYPPFAATLLFEIYKIKENGAEYEIKVHYISQTEKLPYHVERLRLDRCVGLTDYRCLLKKFRNSLQPLINVDWMHECKIGNLSEFDPIQAAENDLGNI